ncbi:FAD-dependent oxidoreductase [Phytoactinopolyspora halotolerans]|uniref:FAD-dependent oxidoreductase n=1 Tax=Phytoactinopolyspora halotolerans TaxID=1981512 RepID=A0A6L9S1M6_9ACTN|nr:FAD-dependent oxidoreductase [Phytoactinopolyspora halotolerans]NED99095.1 FAD-dependent oxidoreductase [Phytoactinopolyspora halotolerans]
MTEPHLSSSARAQDGGEDVGTAQDAVLTEPAGSKVDGVYDLVVIGAGLMGACTAWAAGRRGLRTAVLDQFEPGHPHGSSHGTSRIFRRVYPDPFYVELTAHAADSWQRLEDDTGVVLRRFTGAVDHGPDREPHRLAQWLSDASVPHELLSAEEAGKRWPQMRFTTDALYHPDAGVLDADLAVVSALARASSDGVDVHTSAKATMVAPGGDHVVVQVIIGDERVPLRTRRVVLAAGPWNQPWLARLLGKSAPALTVTQQQVMHFRQREPAEDWPVIVHRDLARTDLEGIGVFALPAGRAAPRAVKVGEHGHGTVTTAEGRDAQVDPASVERLVRYVDEFLPGLSPEPFLKLSCLYTRTPTEDFVIDTVGPLVVCSPCSGHGAKFGAYIGELVTSMITGDGSPPDRFTLRAHASAPAP